MEILSDKYKSDVKREDPFLVAIHAVRGFVRRLAGFFTVTKEERLKAGIFFNGEGRDG